MIYLFICSWKLCFDLKKIQIYCIFFVCYQVGVKIDASSFSLTRMVTFLPFYILVNGTKHPIFICEDGQDNWAQVDPQQVLDASFLFFWSIITNRMYLFDSV